MKSLTRIIALAFIAAFHNAPAAQAEAVRVSGPAMRADIAATTPERVNLEGQALVSVTNEMAVRDGDPRVVKLGQPNLRLFRCRKPFPRGTILLFPGGGYQILSVTKEGSSVAQVLNEASYDVAVLEYSIAVPEARDKALAEALQAIGLFRKSGESLGLNTRTLGIMGFSAGGHLAARTMHALGSKEALDFGILIYPAYLDRGQELQSDVIPPAGAKTAIFALIADNDHQGWVAGTKAYVEACRTNGQHQELHLLRGGGHGFGIVPNLPPPLDAWPGLMRAFLESPALANGSATATPAKLSGPFVNLEEIILVYKSHFDIGYTHLASEAVHDYRTKMMDGALAVVDQNKSLPPEQQFVWTVPGWPMKKILEDWPGQNPERQQRVRDAFKAGRFASHALPFTMQTEMMEPEGMVRSLSFASKLARDAGRTLPTGAKMTDVPEHTKFLATLLKNAGVNFLHLGCNPASATPRVPLLFWWEGPDGSRLLTMYTSEYGGGLFPPTNWGHKTWLAMLMRGDNQGPPSPGDVKSAIERIHSRLPGVKVRVGTPGDFGDAILKEDLSVLPIIRDDMPDSWIHGPMCNPDGVMLTREAVPNLFAAESLHTLLASWNVATPNPAQAIADGYENSILYYEHTWGGAMSWITKYLLPKDNLGRCENWSYGEKWEADRKAKRFDRLIASWEEHTDYARNASNFVAAPLRENMQALANAVAANGPRTVVFNPLPWKRDAVVKGALVKDVPAGGYKTIPSDKTVISEKPSKTALENTAFRITVDPARGTIRSLVDKRSGRELVDANGEHGFGQYLHEKFSADEVIRYSKAYIRGNSDWGWVELGKPNLPPSSEVPYRALTPSNCTVTTTTLGDSTTIEMRAAPKPDGVNYPVTTRITLHGNAPYVDIELTIDKPADNWPEAGWICLPFKVDAPQFRVGRNGFIMDPAGDIIPGANRYLYAVGTGVAVYDAAGRGVGVCGPDTPLVSLGAPGCWKFDYDYVPEKPAVYFNLFNNQWSTNYRFWNEGKWTYRFRIWSFDHYDAASALITPSLETRYPVQTATVNAPAGKLRKTQSGLTVSRPGTLVTAFGQNPDGEGTLLRVWEQAGASGKLTITLPRGATFKTARPVNLRGEKSGDPVPIRSGKLTFDLGSYAPASFILLPEPAALPQASRINSGESANKNEKDPYPRQPGFVRGARDGIPRLDQRQ